MINYPLTALTVCVALFIISFPAYAQKVVVENFSALDCPQSYDSEDNIAQIIKDNKDVLVISCHVKLSGEETKYSFPVCAEKKSRYVQRYTFANQASPTIAINGTYLTKGYYPKIVTSGINMARVESSLANLPLKIENDILSTQLPAQTEKGYYEIWFYAYDRQEAEPIDIQASALNPAQTRVVTFNNVVKKVKRLGSWNGSGESISIPLKDLDTDGYAILVQGVRAGPLLAAGYIEPDKSL